MKLAALRAWFTKRCAEDDEMTCPACGGRMRELIAEDVAVCRMCGRRQTGRELAAKRAKQSADKWLEAVHAIYPGIVPPEFFGIPPPRRRDGIDPANAYIICGGCNMRWYFPDMEPGDYELLPCQHGFLRRDPNASGRAAFYGFGADYVMTMEPPE